MKGFLAEESSPGKPWKVPPEGKLWLEFEYQRVHIQVRTEKPKRAAVTDLQQIVGKIHTVCGVSVCISDTLSTSRFPKALPV